MAPRALAALLLPLLSLAHGLSSRPHAVRRSAGGIPDEVREFVNNPNVTNAIPDSYMVVLNSNISAADLEAMRQSVQAQVKRRNVRKRSVDGRMLSDEVDVCSINSWHAMRVECAPDMVQELASHPLVKDIEANSLMQYPELWADQLVKREEADVPCTPEKRNNSTAQAPRNPCMICVLDSGVNNHTEFGNRLMKGKNFTKEPTMNDTNGHGTHVAALAAGATISEAPNCMVLPIKILRKDGGGDVMDITQGLKFCRDSMRAMNLTSATANLSVGGGKSLCVNTVVDEVAGDGVISVAAAGNEREDARTASPASADTAITVGAVDAKEKVASFSDFGEKVGIFAEGVNVCSASNKDPDSYRVVSGTSQACPKVSGKVAKKLSQDESLEPPNSTVVLASIQNDAKNANSTVKPQANGDLGLNGAEPLVLEPPSNFSVPLLSNLTVERKRRRLR